PTLRCQIWLCDVSNDARMERIFQAGKPDFVWHTAALKHVPIAEEFPLQTIETNLFGTRTVSQLCLRHQVKAMVLISTDKAVYPSSVMGTTKKLAESWMQMLDRRELQTRFITVRFGNVLGSNGSVVPLFQRQLKHGGPLTITHRDVTRYFMSLNEAVQLILQATILGLGERHKAGSIYILEMGKPVLIDELARKMIRFAGLRPDSDIQINYTGLRSGEKLHEQLLYEAESDAQTISPSIIQGYPAMVDADHFSTSLDHLQHHCRAHDQKMALELIRTLLIEPGKACN
ncbi:MAG: polysaccharide biosynthesis protein, partial [Pseudomonadota bacterium]